MNYTLCIVKDYALLIVHHYGNYATMIDVTNTTFKIITVINLFIAIFDVPTAIALFILMSLALMFTDWIETL